MHSRPSAFVGALALWVTLFGAPSHKAVATLTGTTGGDQSFSTAQPYLGLNYIIGVETAPDQLGEIVLSATNTPTTGWLPANGLLLPITGNTALYNKIGTTYGGDGVTTFALPDLRSRVAIGDGQGSGLTNRALGAPVGSTSVTLTESQLPAHTHTVPGGATTSAGSGLPVSNMQSSLPVNFAVVTSGIFPSNGGDPSLMPYLAQIKTYAGNALPAGNTSADGQELNIAPSTALFSLLGTSYGGDGQFTFALPDLRGRALIGAGQGESLTPHNIAENLGVESVTLTQNQLPSHSHTLPGGGSTGFTGGGQAFENMQPSLALQYVIALFGIVAGTDGETPFVGEITPFAGNFVPGGWALCDGQLLSIFENEVLYTLIGTTYGGDGIDTFALPDLRGRVPVGAGGSVALGEIGGAETKLLSISEMAGHDHDFVAVPEPATFALAGLGALMLGVVARRRRRA